MSDTPTQGPTHQGFVVQTAVFSGTLGELAQALRTARLTPQAFDVYKLVRDYLEYYRRVAAADLELATETLPGLARIIELKARLLLPRPAKSEEDEGAAVEEVLEAVLMLEAFETAIAFLHERRETRRFLLPAHTPRPPYPRRPRPLKIKLDRLAELASRHRLTSYFELAIERLTLASATARLREALGRLRRGSLSSLAGAHDWPTLVVSFTAMLELVKEGEVRAVQGAPYSPLELEALEDTPRGTQSAAKVREVA